MQVKMMRYISIIFLLLLAVLLGVFIFSRVNENPETSSNSGEVLEVLPPIQSGVKKSHPGKFAKMPVVQAGSDSHEMTLPPSGAPWEDVYSQLFSRGESGDVRAATRLFEDTIRCNNYLFVSRQIDKILNMYSQATPTERTLRDHDAALLKLENRLKEAVKSCSQVNAGELASVIYSVVRQAALLGNSNAQICYVDAGVFDKAHIGANLLSKVKADYAGHVLQVAQAGIEGGNWAMAFLMEQAYASSPLGIGGRSWLGEVVQPDPLGMYSYLLLEKRGRESRGDDTIISDELMKIRNEYGFSAADVKAASVWAEHMYSVYFSQSPYPDGVVGVTCGAD